MLDGSTITELLRQVNDDIPGAADRLFSVVYAELRQCARKQLLNGPLAAHALSPTTLVHETYIRLLGKSDRKQSDWQNERHFFFCITRAMRDIQIEIYRRNSAAKRGGNVRHLPLTSEVPAPESSDPTVLAEAIDQLKQANEVAGCVANLRLFGGLSHEEIALLLGIANSTVRRHWKFALGFLTVRLKG